MLEDMKDLVKFCEENLHPSKKRVIIREPSIQEKEEGETSPRVKKDPNSPLKSSLTTKNKATFFKQSEKNLTAVSKISEEN